jgi:hypothetical protein
MKRHCLGGIALVTCIFSLTEQIGPDSVAQTEPVFHQKLDGSERGLVGNLAKYGRPMSGPVSLQ